jgi:hypothetical protein
LVVRTYSIAVVVALMASNLAVAGEQAMGSQSLHKEADSREPVIGLGYHPGNFIGPFAFDIVVRALPHVTLDLQAGYSRERPANRLGVAPHIQWEFRRGLHTPYLGIAFRYERVWLDRDAVASTGGCLIGGWQVRWQSGLGLLFGVGVLYKTPVNITTTAGGYYDSGGLFGTYEIGIRYFF